MSKENINTLISYWEERLPAYEDKHCYMAEDTIKALEELKRLKEK